MAIVLASSLISCSIDFGAFYVLVMLCLSNSLWVGLGGSCSYPFLVLSAEINKRVGLFILVIFYLLLGGGYEL